MNKLPSSLQKEPLVAPQNRRTRSLFNWIARVTGNDAVWIEGIVVKDKPLWALAKKVTEKAWYIFSRKLKPAVAVTALGGAMLMPIANLQAQSFNVSARNGVNATGIFGESGNDFTAHDLSTGDINGDGISDVLLTGRNNGKAYVVFGTSDGFSPTSELSALNGSDGFVFNGIKFDDQFYSVASTDINSDGTDDLVIGARHADPGNKTDAGETYVVFGNTSVGSSGTINASDLNGSNGFSIIGSASGNDSGEAIGVGDINVDGVSDIIIGSPAADSNSKTSAGKINVLFGGASVGSTGTVQLSDLNGTNGFVLNGVDADDKAGTSVASGDINGDGKTDVIIGSYRANSFVGETYVVFGGNSVGSGGTVELSGLSGTDGFKVNGDGADQSSRSVASGDVNGDGTDDVIIGARLDDTNGTNSGEVYVVFGKTSGYASSLDASNLSGSDGFVIRGEGGLAGFGVGTGDVDGNGIDDILIGAERAGGSGVGRSYTVFGGSTVGSTGTFQLSGLDGSNGFYVQGENTNDRLGANVAAADINGDGFSDLVASSYTGKGTTGSFYTGETYVFFNMAGAKITGNEGFRTLSAPKSGAVFNDMLGPFWTQGFTGSDAPGAADANVFTWDETLGTEGDWAVLSDQNTTSLPAGQGFLLFAFSDDDADGTAEGFPKPLGIGQFGGTGTFNSGSITPVSSLGDGRFFMAGNPYRQTIDWDNLDKFHLSNTVHVWDDVNNTWQSWNGTTGGLTGGLIAPLQGFFIQGSGGSGSLTIEEADISATKTSLLKENTTEPLVLELNLQSGNGEQSNRTWLQFDEQALPGRDKLDGLELTPLASNYLQLFTKDLEGEHYDIQALPANGPVELPLGMIQVSEGTSIGSEALLSWSGLEAFPDDWSLQLVDTSEGMVTDLREADQANVTIEATDIQQKTTQTGKSNPGTLLLGSSEDDSAPRYRLRITPGTLTDVEKPGAELPQAFELKQNFPNPFNPSTSIEFNLPQQAEVQLRVYDMMGREVATLLNEARAAGSHSVIFDASNLASGVYVYRLQAGSQVFTRKMVLIK